MKLNKLYHKFMRWLWLEEPPKQKAGDITLHGQQGELTVSIGKYKDESVKRVHKDWLSDKELNIISVR